MVYKSDNQELVFENIEQKKEIAVLKDVNEQIKSQVEDLKHF